MQLFFVGNGYDLTTANPLKTSKTPNFILRNLFTPNVGTFRTGTVQLQRYQKEWPNVCVFKTQSVFDLHKTHHKLYRFYKFLIYFYH